MIIYHKEKLSIICQNKQILYKKYISYKNNREYKMSDC